MTILNEYCKWIIIIGKVISLGNILNYVPYQLMGLGSFPSAQQGSEDNKSMLIL